MSGDPQLFIRAFGQRASKALGQHFLHDPNVLQRITQACGLKKEDHALEIGPGPGVLTQALLGTGVRLTVMEKDRRAVEFLKTRFTALVGPTAAQQLHVMEADALELKLNELDLLCALWSATCPTTSAPPSSCIFWSSPRTRSSVWS